MYQIHNDKELTVFYSVITPNSRYKKQNAIQINFTYTTGYRES